MWKNGGLLKNGYIGFIEGLKIQVFDLVGIEIVGKDDEEEEKKMRKMKKEINNIKISIVIFYIGEMFVIIKVNKWNKVEKN